MTKKDYIKLADALKRGRATNRVVYEVAVLQNENSAFDRDRFYRAAGYDSSREADQPRVANLDD